MGENHKAERLIFRWSFHTVYFLEEKKKKQTLLIWSVCQTLHTLSVLALLNSVTQACDLPPVQVSQQAGSNFKIIPNFWNDYCRIFLKTLLITLQQHTCFCYFCLFSDAVGFLGRLCWNTQLSLLGHSEENKIKVISVRRTTLNWFVWELPWGFRDQFFLAPPKFCTSETFALFDCG